MAQKFTGTQKAAILLMQAGKERASTVLRSMREQEVAEIMAEVARLHHLEVNEIEEVLNEFPDIYTARAHVAQGGYSTARELLEASFGGSKADEILDNLGVTMVAAPFEFLRRADTRQVLTYLQDEHPQTIALVLAHMHPDAAAMVLSSLPEELQRDVALRIAKMDRTSPEVIEQVEAILERKLSTVIQQSDFAQAGGLQTLVDILNSSDRTTERLILEGLEQEDAELADEVRNRMFVFEDIAGPRRPLDPARAALGRRQGARSCAQGCRPEGAQQGHEEHVRARGGEPRRGNPAARTDQVEDGRRSAGRHRAGHPHARGSRPDRHVERRR